MSQGSQIDYQILEILKRRGFLSPMAAKTLVGFMERWDVDAYRAVTETHAVEESRLADILAEEFHLTRINRLRSRPVDRKALSYLSYKDAMLFYVLPYAFDEHDNLLVAISDPTSREGIDKISDKWKKTFLLHISEQSEIESAIQRNYPLSLQLPSTMASCVSSREGY